MEIQTPSVAPSSPKNEARNLRELSPQQWKSGIAAWLGWLFDGLDMHLYTLVAAPFVMRLVHAGSTADPAVKQYSSWIQAAFLIGWALGGGVFGRIGDRLGRSRTLSLTILTYAVFTGLSFFVENWWQLMLCRFLAALGIGGEWAVGASLLSETWPRRWRPWMAAVLQSAVNVGVLLASVITFAITAFLPRYVADYERYVFLVGILPALMVFWIRRHVPESEEWSRARGERGLKEPGVMDLFRGPVRRITLLTIGVCSLSLTGWWAFMFWHPQHLRSLPELQGWEESARTQLTTKVFFLVNAASILGNLAAGALARLWGYRRTMVLLFLLFLVTFATTYSVPRSHQALMWWLPCIGFCSGVFGLFTMYLPPLFPVLLRTTGAGFCYNIGRVAAALGTVVFGMGLMKVDFRFALLAVGALFLPAVVVGWHLPELSGEEGGTGQSPAKLQP